VQKLQNQTETHPETVTQAPAAGQRRETAGAGSVLQAELQAAGRNRRQNPQRQAGSRSNRQGSEPRQAGGRQTQNPGRQRSRQAESRQAGRQARQTRRCIQATAEPGRQNPQAGGAKPGRGRTAGRKSVIQAAGRCRHGRQAGSSRQQVVNWAGSGRQNNPEIQHPEPIQNAKKKKCSRPRTAGRQVAAERRTQVVAEIQTAERQVAGNPGNQKSRQAAEIRRQAGIQAGGRTIQNQQAGRTQPGGGRQAGTRRRPETNPTEAGTARIRRRGGGTGRTMAESARQGRQAGARQAAAR